MSNPSSKPNRTAPPINTPAILPISSRFMRPAPLAFGFGIVAPAHIYPRIALDRRDRLAGVSERCFVSLIEFLGVLFLCILFNNYRIVVARGLGQNRPRNDGQKYRGDDISSHGGPFFFFSRGYH